MTVSKGVFLIHSSYVNAPWRGGSVWRLTNVSACNTFKSTKPVASWLHIRLFSFELRSLSKSEMFVASYALKKVFFCHLIDQGINHYLPNTRARID